MDPPVSPCPLPRPHTPISVPRPPSPTSFAFSPIDPKHPPPSPTITASNRPLPSPSPRRAPTTPTRSSTPSIQSSPARGAKRLFGLSDDEDAPSRNTPNPLSSSNSSSDDKIKSKSKSQHASATAAAAAAAGSAAVNGGRSVDVHGGHDCNDEGAISDETAAEQERQLLASPPRPTSNLRLPAASPPYGSGSGSGSGSGYGYTYTYTYTDDADLDLDVARSSPSPPRVPVPSPSARSPPLAVPKTGKGTGTGTGTGTGMGTVPVPVPVQLARPVWGGVAQTQPLRSGSTTCTSTGVTDRPRPAPAFRLSTSPAHSPTEDMAEVYSTHHISDHPPLGSNTSVSTATSTATSTSTCPSTARGAHPVLLSVLDMVFHLTTCLLSPLVVLVIVPLYTGFVHAYLRREVRVWSSWTCELVAQSVTKGVLVVPPVPARSKVGVEGSVGMGMGGGWDGERDKDGWNGWNGGGNGERRRRRRRRTGESSWDRLAALGAGVQTGSVVVGPGVPVGGTVGGGSGGGVGGGRLPPATRVLSDVGRGAAVGVGMGMGVPAPTQGGSRAPLASSWSSTRAKGVGSGSGSGSVGSQVPTQGGASPYGQPPTPTSASSSYGVKAQSPRRVRSAGQVGTYGGVAYPPPKDQPGQSGGGPADVPMKPAPMQYRIRTPPTSTSMSTSANTSSAPSPSPGVKRSVSTTSVSAQAVPQRARSASTSAGTGGTVGTAGAGDARHLLSTLPAARIVEVSSDAELDNDVDLNIKRAAYREAEERTLVDAPRDARVPGSPSPSDADGEESEHDGRGGGGVRPFTSFTSGSAAGSVFATTVPLKPGHGDEEPPYLKRRAWSDARVQRSPTAGGGVGGAGWRRATVMESSPGRDINNASTSTSASVPVRIPSAADLVAMSHPLTLTQLSTWSVDGTEPTGVARLVGEPATLRESVVKLVDKAVGRNGGERDVPWRWWAAARGLRMVMKSVRWALVKVVVTLGVGEVAGREEC